jgi:uncharacterized phage protein gp47/JayE
MIPAFNYTARDFATLRNELRVILLNEIPEWADTPSSFESVLMDMFAYVGDILHFYIDRYGAEAYLQTGVRRESLLNLAYMFGYIPTPQTASKTSVRFTRTEGVAEDVIIRRGTQVFAQVEGDDAVIFETTEERVIPAASATGIVDVEVVEGVAISRELIGVSTGDPLMTFPLFNPAVIKNSVRVYTMDGNIDPQTGEPTPVEWAFSERIIDGAFYDRVFSLYTDADNSTYVQFGDGVTGAVPAVGVSLYADYRFGKGVRGNVAAGAIRSLVSGGDLVGRIESVTNLTAAQGGADPESIESMRRSIPKSLRAIERAVTREDFASLAVRVGGVAKASANPASSVTSIQLAVAPVGGGIANASLLSDVEEYLAFRKMIGVDVVAAAHVNVPINVSVTVKVDARYRNDDVGERVRLALLDLYSFDNAEFGQRITRAAVFKATTGIEGVEYIEVTTFNRDGNGADADFDLAYNELAQAGTINVSPTGGIAPT